MFDTVDSSVETNSDGNIQNEIEGWDHLQLQTVSAQCSLYNISRI